LEFGSYEVEQFSTQQEKNECVRKNFRVAYLLRVQGFRKKAKEKFLRGKKSSGKRGLLYLQSLLSEHGLSSSGLSRRTRNTTLWPIGTFATT
jgi:hypothetical protein